MMFAVRLERNIAQQHDLVIAADLFESAGQMNRRVLDIAVAIFLPRARDALRRFAQPIARGIVAPHFARRPQPLCPTHREAELALPPRTRSLTPANSAVPGKRM